MICATCREPVAHDGPLGYVHEDGRMVGNDGHPVVPIKGAPSGRE
jgi:hypothetical protein